MVSPNHKRWGEKKKKRGPVFPSQGGCTMRGGAAGDAVAGGLTCRDKEKKEKESY